MRGFPKSLFAVGPVRLALALVLPLFLPAAGLAQEEPLNASALFRGPVGGPLPNASLPEHVPAPEGQLTLFADFAAAQRASVPLYVINRTTAPVSFASQDNDIYIKLETSGDGKIWERAQSHVGSWCGNSYYAVVLPPGQFFQSSGYLSGQGKKERVRFSCYGSVPLVSNQGEGLVAPADLDAARNDGMALLGIPPTMVRLLYQDKNSGPRLDSPLSERVAALRLLQSFGNSPKLKHSARTFADTLSSSPKVTPEERRAAGAVHDLLAGPWPAQPSPDALFDRCLRALEGPGGQAATGFGMPENEPALVWNILADLATSGSDPDSLGSPSMSVNPARWAPVMAKMAGVLESESSLATDAVARILESSQIVDETLPNAFFEKALLSPDFALQRTSALVLSRRAQWSRLAELGWKLPPEGQLAVFLALACPPSDARELSPWTRDPDDSGEHKFWAHCLKTQPLKAAWGLSTQSRSRSHSQFDRTVHDPLREFLMGEAARSDQLTDDFKLEGESYQMQAAVNFLATWNLEEDREVFTRLLKYRGYERQEGLRGDAGSALLRPYVFYSFSVREAARRALLKQGVAVPENLEVKRDMTPPPASK